MEGVGWAQQLWVVYMLLYWLLLAVIAFSILTLGYFGLRSLGRRTETVGLGCSEATQLASAEDWQLRHQVAADPRAPEEVLTRLAIDINSEVRMAVARNPRAPRWLLESLARDLDDEVRAAAQRELNSQH